MAPAPARTPTGATGTARRCALAAIVALVALPAAARAATITVTAGDDNSPGCTLRKAITSANGGADLPGCSSSGAYGNDTVVVPASIPSPIQLGAAEIAVGNGGGTGTLAITGPGAASLDVRAGTDTRVFHVTGSRQVAISGMTISHGSIKSSSEPGGGGIRTDSGSNLTLDHVAVTGNQVNIRYASAGTAGGGGVESSGALVVRDSTIAGNVVTARPVSASGTITAQGGGIDQTASGSLEIHRSTISGNTAFGDPSGQGGGLSKADGGDDLIERTTISENTVQGGTGATGGGAWLTGTGTTLIGDTITGNTVSAAEPTATKTGANLAETNTVAYSSIISNAHGAANCARDVTDQSGGHNLEDANSCGFGAAADQASVSSTGLDPNLADNGGPTKTHALLPGSPAIDAGKSFGATTDQRGLSRPVDFPGNANAAGGDGTDIGAFEIQSACAGQTNALQGCHNVTVTKAGAGSGTVTSSPPGIACGLTCTHIFGSTSATLTAAPAAGSTFAGWSGACSGTGACIVSTNSDQSVVATFVPAQLGGGPPPPLTLSALGVSPSRFRLAGRRVGGRCVAPTRQNGKHRRCRRPLVLTVSYTLNAPAVVTLRIQRSVSGRKVKGRCVARTRRNRRAHPCTRLVTFGSAISHASATGVTSFVFSGPRLAPGSYQLVVTPAGGATQRIGFRVAR